jgi:hypothetical protein
MRQRQLEGRGRGQVHEGVVVGQDAVQDGLVDLLLSHQQLQWLHARRPRHPILIAVFVLFAQLVEQEAEAWSTKTTR